MTKGKIALITLLFVVATFVIPLIILLAFFSANDYATSVYVSVFGVMFFASIGFLLAMVLSIKKEVKETIEEIKVQNAAIAFRLTEIKKLLSTNQVAVSSAEADLTTNVNPSSAPLNPSSSVADEAKTIKASTLKQQDKSKEATENFDDFN